MRVRPTWSIRTIAHFKLSESGSNECTRTPQLLCNKLCGNTLGFQGSEIDEPQISPQSISGMNHQGKEDTAC